jgi:citronellol/citronellal dehydrogenase
LQFDGLAEELRVDGIEANSIWPRTPIATDAVRNTVGADLMPRSRNAEIVAEALYAILTSPSRETTANLFIDEDVLWGGASPTSRDTRRSARMMI